MSDLIGQNEAALVAGAQNGNRQALKALLLRNWSWLRGLVRGLVSDQHDVDDVLQNISLRVISRIGTLREPERFSCRAELCCRRY